MSYCHILNRNLSNDNSKRYLESTARKLRRSLQKWIMNLIDSNWMYVDPIRESIEDNALFYPLALIDVNHQGKSSSAIPLTNSIFKNELGSY